MSSKDIRKQIGERLGLVLRARVSIQNLRSTLTGGDAVASRSLLETYLRTMTVARTSKN